jgi:hypothetical protein
MSLARGYRMKWSLVLLPQLVLWWRWRTPFSWKKMLTRRYVVSCPSIAAVQPTP